MHRIPAGAIDLVAPRADAGGLFLNDTFDLARLRQEQEQRHGRRSLPQRLDSGVLLIGIGHDLSRAGLPDDLIDGLFASDVARASDILDAQLEWWRDLPRGRQRAILSLQLEFGMGWLQAATGFLKWLQRHDWHRASEALKTAALNRPELTQALLGLD